MDITFSGFNHGDEYGFGEWSCGRSSGTITRAYNASRWRVRCIWHHGQYSEEQAEGPTPEGAVRALLRALPEPGTSRVDHRIRVAAEGKMGFLRPERGNWSAELSAFMADILDHIAGVDATLENRATTDWGQKFLAQPHCTVIYARSEIGTQLVYTLHRLDASEHESYEIRSLGERASLMKVSHPMEFFELRRITPTSAEGQDAHLIDIPDENGLPSSTY